MQNQVKREITMRKIGKRKKQIITQFTVDILFLASGIVLGIVVMLAVALIAI